MDLAAWGHKPLFHHVVQTAVVRLARNNHRAGFTPLQRRVIGAEVELFHFQAGAMASEARALCQNWHDVGFKCGWLGWGIPGRLAWSGQQHEAERACGKHGAYTPNAPPLPG